MRHDRTRTEPDVFAVLELLANDAPAERFEALTENARSRGMTGDQMAELEYAKRLGLGISARGGRRQQREAGLKVLVDTALGMSVQSDLDGLLREIVRRARMLLSADMAYLSLPADDGDGLLAVRAADGHISTRLIGLRLLEPGTGLAGAVLAEQAPFWTPDYLVDDRIAHSVAIDDVIRVESLRAVIAVPLSSGTRTFGALYVGERNVRHFTADEISLLSELGALAGVAIERNQLLATIAATAVSWEQRAVATEAELNRTRELSTAHGELVSLLLGGGDVHVLVDEASRRLNGACRMYGSDGTVLASAGEMADRPDSAVVLATMDAHAAREPIRLDGGIWAAPIFAGEENLGTLLLRPDHEVTDRDRARLATVAQTAAIALLLENKQTALADSQAREQLLDDLLSTPRRPPQQLQARARRLGVDLAEPHLVVVARTENSNRGRMVVWAASYAQRMNGLKSIRKGSPVLFVPGSRAGGAARAVHDELSSLLGDTATVAAAGPATGPTAAVHAYHEALRCLDAMTALGATGTAAATNELGFLGVLLSDDRDVGAFIEATIGPIVDYDQQRATELVPTLDAYFEKGCSPLYAAEKLHVHPNTVARRLERVGVLLGADWQQPDRALDIQLALRLIRIRRALGDGAAPPDSSPGEQG